MTYTLRQREPFELEVRRAVDYYAIEAELGEAVGLGAERIETVVLESNLDGLEFALKHGFVEHDRYLLEGDRIPFVDLHLGSHR